MKLPDPRPVEVVISVPREQIKTDLAAATRGVEKLARAELGELAREQDRDLEIVDIELVETGQHFFLRDQWSFFFRGTPVWRRGAKRRKR